MGEGMVMGRCLAWVFAAVAGAFIVTGCPAGHHDDDDADDPVTDDDTGGTPDDDDTTDDDDSSIPADDDSADDDSADDDTFDPDETGGHVTLNIGRSVSGGMFTQSSNFSASFSDCVEPGSGGVEFVDYPENPDECGLFVYSYSDMAGYVPGEYVYLSAGPITVAGPNVIETFVMDPSLHMYHGSFPDEMPLAFGDTYTVQAAGDGVPSFTALMTMPLDLTLLTPSLYDTAVFEGDVHVQWTGGDVDPLTMGLSVTSNDLFDPVTGWIACYAANDGDFTIPAALVDQLPPGQGSLFVTAAVTDYQQVDGRWIAFNASFSSNVTGYAP